MRTAAGTTGLIVKILAIGVFLALLAYILHPDVANVHIVINGQPVATSAGYFAAIPALLLMGLFVGILIAMIFLGVSMMFFIVFLLLGVFAFAFLMPYFSPVLAIVMLTLLLVSLGDRSAK